MSLALHNGTLIDMIVRNSRIDRTGALSFHRHTAVDVLGMNELDTP